MTTQATNKLLLKAKKAKSDEFYTQLCDIERELQHYTNYFVGKVVYCNCDDPQTSNFFRYFKDNFQKLGIRKLIASCFSNVAKVNDNRHIVSNAYYCEYEGEDIPKKVVKFEGNGDFRSTECIELLQCADVVVTNPPFSLFREFVGQMMHYNKQFLVIGNVNAITYKEIFELIQKNRVWLGVNFGRGISGFIVPEHYQLYGSEVKINDKGQRIIATNGCLWLTNIELNKRHEDIIFKSVYIGNEDKYPKYDNCHAINVNRTKDIPKDYDGLMGVPITFLHKYNPDQFEIVKFRKGDDGKDLRINGKSTYFRILIRNKKSKVNE